MLMLLLSIILLACGVSLNRSDRRRREAARSSRRQR